MSDGQRDVVFDCVVFAQSLINPAGPAGECVKRAKDRDIRLFVSEWVVGEIRELHLKIPSKYGVTIERTVAFLQELRAEQREQQ